jgi:hypothetical protein
MSAHTVTAEFSGDGWPVLTMTCHEPPESACHAKFDCECEAYTRTGVEDGIPWHEDEAIGDDDAPERHFGRFDPDECNLRNWAENSDEWLTGKVTFPVTSVWEGDYYRFEIDEVTR